MTDDRSAPADPTRRNATVHQTRILIAPSGFKESLSATETAEAIAEGIRRALPDAPLQLLPLVDGGEGFAEAVVAAAGGRVEHRRVTGPVGDRVTAPLGWLPERTAVLDMASAAGLRLVPPTRRDPGSTTTRGVGELIRAALDGGARHIVLGCGDSGTNDGGAGMAVALGARLLDAAGNDLPDGGRHLVDLDRIDLDGLDPRLASVPIEAACNITNVLCGPRGVARVYGPQKGADEATVELLAMALDRYAKVIQRDLGTLVGGCPGGGASGGLGAGLLAFTGATLRPRMDVVTRWFDVDRAILASDLVVTAEGSLDRQTPNGKIPAEMARRAHARGIPVIALAGTLGRGARRTLDAGLDAYLGILRSPCELPEAISHAAEWLADAAEQAARLLSVGEAVHNRAPFASTVYSPGTPG